MSSEIVRRDDILPDESEVVAELDRLEEQGDTATLNELARQAQAHQEYEARANAQERANYFGKIKVQAEARIGSIDLDLHPTPGTSTLTFDGWEVSRMIRGRWRILGLGLQAGQLDKAIRMTEDAGDVVSTWGVSGELTQWGVLWIATGPLLRRYRHLYTNGGLKVSHLEDRTGIKGLTQYLARPGKTPPRNKMRRHLAFKLADELRVERSKLRPVRSTKPPHRKRRRMHKQKALPGGRLDEAYTLIRRALQGLDRASGSGDRYGTDDAWEHLYKAEEIVGRALKRATA